MEKYKVIKLEPSDYHIWDQFVDKAQEGKIFHSTRWLLNVSDDLEVWVVVGNNSNIVGGVAIPIMNQHFIPNSPIPPLTPYLGPIFSYPSHIPDKNKFKEQRELIYFLLSHLSHIKQIDFCIPIETHDLSPYIEAGFKIQIHYTHIIPNIEHYKDNLSKRKQQYLKNLYRLVESGNMVIEEIKYIEQLIPLMHHSYLKLNPKIYKKIFSPDNYSHPWRSLVLKNDQGNLVSAIVLVVDKNWSYYLMGGHNDKLPGILHHSNLLLHNIAIENSLKEGRKYDFEGSSIPSIALYFRQLGGTPYPIARVSRYHSLKLTLAKEIRDYFVRKKREMEFYRNFRI